MTVINEEKPLLVIATETTDLIRGPNGMQVGRSLSNATFQIVCEKVQNDLEIFKSLIEEHSALCIYLTFGYTH